MAFPQNPQQQQPMARPPMQGQPIQQPPQGMPHSGAGSPMAQPQGGTGSGMSQQVFDVLAQRIQTLDEKDVMVLEQILTDDALPLFQKLFPELIKMFEQIDEMYPDEEESDADASKEEAYSAMSSYGNKNPLASKGLIG